MRSPLWWFLAAVPIAAAATAPGCNQLSGIDDYEKAPLQGAASCALNADCAGLGEGYICRKGVASYCVSLLSEDCPAINGDYTNDDAFIFASILPTLPAGAVTPGPGAPLLNAMRLAVADFTGSAVGLPPLAEGRSRRPLVMLECNDQGDLATAKRAAEHAVREVGLPAVLGPMFSGLTLQVATDIAIPNGAFLLSPTAATQSLTELKDFGLVWRAAPSADLQVQVLANFLTVIEKDPVARASFGLLKPDDFMTVASVYKDDAFGGGLAGGLRGKLTFNKNPATSQPNNDYFFEYNYGNPDNPTLMPPRFQAVADDIIAKQPHVVLLLGVEEITRDLLPLIESGWTGTRRPFYLSASGPYTPSLFSYVEQNDATTGIRRRIVGVVPGSNNNVFNAFRSKYGSIYDISEADTSGPANAYDAVYMLAYSVVGLGEAPITGASIAQAMKRLVRPAQVTVSAGPLDINTAYGELSSLRNINFEGASGPLDFNVENGDPNSEMQIWCVGPNNRGKYSGPFYDTKNVLTGSMVEVRANCVFPP